MSYPIHRSVRATTQPRFTRRLAMAVAMAIGVGGTSIGSRTGRAATKISIALDWYPNANHVGIYWALSEGIFSQADLDVTIHTPADPSAVLQTVAAGRDTFGISYQPDILLARSQDVPVIAVASIVPRPLLGIMSLASAAISSPLDLAGKTVGYPGIPAQEAFLRTMLAGQDLSIEDIALVNVEFNLLPALLSNQALAVMGAYWTHESIVAEQQGYPVAMMKVEDWGVPLYDELVLVASEDFVAESPEIVDAVRSALQHGYALAARDQVRALEILKDASDEVDLAVETVGLALLAKIWLESGANLGQLDQTKWSEFIYWMVEEQLLTANLDTADFLYPPATQLVEATPVP